MKQYVGAKLTAKQREIATEIISSSAMYHVICSGRQNGKSYLCKQLLLYFAINNPQWQIMYVSMTYSQTNKLYKEILNAIKPSGVIAYTNSKENSIVLVNGSEIYFKSYNNADAIRGYSLDLLIIDEAAYCKDEDWNAVFRPTLAVRGKKCVLCSTPRGRNWFYTLFQYGIDDENHNFKSYKATYKDNPFANADEINSAKKQLPEKIFQSEYLAEFVDGSLSVFDGVSDCVNNELPTGKKYAAIDVGRQNDYTVLTVMSGGNVIYIGRWRNQTWETITNNIIVQLRCYQPISCWVEVNGIGDVFVEMLQTALQTPMNADIRTKIKPWVTSNQSKNNAVEQLISDFQTRSINIPNNDDLLFELNNFECSFSKTNRAICYSGRQGVHDDCVMSLAICNYNRQRNKNAGVYYFG